MMTLFYGWTDSFLGNAHLRFLLGDQCGCPIELTYCHDVKFLLIDYRKFQFDCFFLKLVENNNQLGHNNNTGTF